METAVHSIEMTCNSNLALRAKKNLNIKHPPLPAIRLPVGVADGYLEWADSWIGHRPIIDFRKGRPEGRVRTHPDGSVR